MTDHPEFHDGYYCAECNPWEEVRARPALELLLESIDRDSEPARAIVEMPDGRRFVFEILHPRLMSEEEEL